MEINESLIIATASTIVAIWLFVSALRMDPRTKKEEVP